ncbi:p25-alpha family protein [Theileria parva strain Muguga]|uniref:EF-hand domain-containing protein n=1 Tax=Theileria parva TaxID=5875 RepID=Q4N792_THEPA|nr:p25-alpha family protein [Theileria parva strain Muguga]EAN34166.1 p25-alpha family protein [Theileria parva strain Muguga]|eukprot:XP_766449.1 hypothetical protein [Theileria parva strain Muguga]
MKLSELFERYRDQNLKGRMFVKMFRDAGLITSYDNSLDLIFAKYKSKCSGINYEQFLKSLEEVSRLLDMKVPELKQRLRESEGPIYRGTEPLAVRLHDDKRLYTGVHLHGGPKIGKQ